MQSLSAVIIEIVWLNISEAGQISLCLPVFFFSSLFSFDKGKTPVLCQSPWFISSLLDAEDLENMNVLSHLVQIQGN